MRKREVNKAFALSVVVLLLFGSAQAQAQGPTFADMTCGLIDGKSAKQCAEELKAKQPIYEAQAKAQKIAEERIAALPAVKRIYSCDEKPEIEDIVNGVNAARKFTPEGYCSECALDPLSHEEVANPKSCQLRNSLAYTPAEIGATYPEDLLGQYVKALQDIRAASPDMQSFNRSALPIVERVKEYAMIKNCANAEFKIYDTIFRKKFNACREPFYTLARSAKNLDQENTVYRPQAMAEVLKNGDVVLADSVELRYNAPHYRLFRIDAAKLTVTPVIGEEFDGFTRSLVPQTTFTGPFNLDRENAMLSLTNADFLTGAMWTAIYALEGDRLVLQEMISLRGLFKKKLYTKEGGLNQKAIGRSDTESNYYARELRRHDPEEARKYKLGRPPLTDAEKTAFRTALEQMKPLEKPAPWWNRKLSLPEYANPQFPENATPAPPGK